MPELRAPVAMLTNLLDGGHNCGKRKSHSPIGGIFCNKLVDAGEGLLGARDSLPLQRI